MDETMNTPDTREHERFGLEAASPGDVVRRSDLSRDEKIRLLRQWEQDLREEMVAEEENMVSAEPMPVSLDDVLGALKQLQAESESHAAPTKHG
jgi:hypothetical protein